MTATLTEETGAGPDSYRPALTADYLRKDPLFARSPLPKWVFDEETLGFLLVNRAACELYGFSEREFAGMTLFDMRPPEEADFLRRALAHDLAKDVVNHAAVHHRTRDGRALHMQIHAMAITLDGRLARLVVARDATEQVATEERIRLYATAVEASANGVLVVDALDPAMPIILANPAFEVITGYEQDEIIGRNCRFLQGEDRQQPAVEQMRQALAERRVFRGLLRNYTKSGQMFWNELTLSPLFDPSGRLTHYVGIQNDVTERIVKQNALEFRDRYDELTGLPNLRHALELLEHAIAQARLHHTRVSLVLLNIDHLHRVNDTLGLAAGDDILMEAARRVQAVSARHEGFAARIGGDEFLVVGASPGEGLSEQVARELAEAMGTPFSVHGTSLHVTASIGTSDFPTASSSAAALLQHADVAARKAKLAGRAQIVRFDAHMAADVADRLTLTAALRTALPSGQLSLHVQPLVHVATGRLGGGEVLLRWTHPVLGQISPVRFIPAAEDSGLIVDIGEWVLGQALGLATAWQATELRPAPALAVNVSAVQLRRLEFVRQVLDAIEASAVPPQRLKLEITESVVMEDPDKAMRMLEQLRSAGVRISLDDFGTGHSSLSYLRRIPIDEVKIDRSFVKDVVDDASAGRLCAAIIDMSRQLGLTVVAEGVETPEQSRFLADAGCDLLQGFLFSRPLHAEGFRALSASDTEWTLDGAMRHGARA